MKSCRLFVLVFLLAVFSAAAQGLQAIKGSYYGLFAEPDGAWSNSSGAIVISTTSPGSYTACLQRGRFFYRFSGQFAPDGSDSRQANSFFARPLTVDLQVDPEDSDTITGSVTDGVWVADLAAY